MLRTTCASLTEQLANVQSQLADAEEWVTPVTERVEKFGEHMEPLEGGTPGQLSPGGRSLGGLQPQSDGLTDALGQSFGRLSDVTLVAI